MSAYVKKAFAVLILLGCLESAYAVDGNSLLIGISIGLGMYAYQGTRNHVVLPVVHAVQRTVRPIPQDKIDKANRKAEKARREALRSHSEGAQQDKPSMSTESPL